MITKPIEYGDDLVSSFYDRVDFYPDTQDVECWGWLGQTDDKGYGRIRDKSSGEVYKSHRLSWTIHKGDIPDGMCICHKCDNPACSNPEHLFVGTQADNVSDMMNKGRGKKAHGEGHAGAKLTELDVAFIRHWMKCGYNNSEIAEVFPVNDRSISNIKIGKTWARVQ